MEKQIEKGRKNLRGLCRHEGGAASVLCEIFHKVGDLGEMRCCLEKKIGPIRLIGPKACANFLNELTGYPERFSSLLFLPPFSRASQLWRLWLFPLPFHLHRCCG